MEDEKIIAALVEKAQAAQLVAAGYTQQQIDDLCLAVGWEVYRDENIARLAALAVEETGMGVTAHKVSKHKNKIMGVLDDIRGVKTVGLIEELPEKGIRKYAKPVGVVGALCPVTNPTATPGSNAVSILKGGNAVIFAPHPKGARCTGLAVELMRQGLRRVGAPEDLIQVVENPSMELTNELMRQVDLVVATGGGAMVKAAYSSGTPAYGVGPGNSCQIVAEDADVADVAAKVFTSKTFDNATSCSSENSLVIHESLYTDLLDAFRSKGAHVCTPEEKETLWHYMWQPNKRGELTINAKIVGASAGSIAAGAGLSLPADVPMLIVEGAMPLEQDQFAHEKLSPVLTVWKYDTFEEGVDILTRLTDNCGSGHSCGIHTFRADYINYLGAQMRTSRIMVRQAQASANGGAFTNGMPSTTTMGCGTWGGNITSENIHWKHFINVTWVSTPIPDRRPTDETVFGDFWERYGK